MNKNFIGRLIMPAVLPAIMGVAGGYGVAWYQSRPEPPMIMEYADIVLQRPAPDYVRRSANAARLTDGDHPVPCVRDIKHGTTWCMAEANNDPPLPAVDPNTPKENAAP